MIDASFGRNWTTRYDTVLGKATIVLPTQPVQCWEFTYSGNIECPSYAAPEHLPWSGAVIQRPDGKSYQFTLSAGIWNGAPNVKGSLFSVIDAANGALTGFNYVDANNDVTEGYDIKGILVTITHRNGRIETLTYSDGETNDTAVGRYPATAPVCPAVQGGHVLARGRLRCVTDQSGRQLQFTYDSKSRIGEVIDPANQSYLYEYDGASGGCVPGNEATFACRANNLTKVTYPDGKSQTYYYNEMSHINGGAVCSNLRYTYPAGNGFGQFANLMTGLVDENGTRYIDWTYNCNARATSSTEANGVNAVTLTYSAIDPATNRRTTSITHAVGPANAPINTTSNLGTEFVLGTGKMKSFDQPCVECGSVKSRTYDANGNVATATHFNGLVTKYTYDLTRNLEESRIEAFGTSMARTISTQWHPTRRLPAVVAEPKRITTYAYDTRGDLLKRTEQATSDLNGAAAFTATKIGVVREWAYTYDLSGNVKTIQEPGATGQTVFEYDPVGNLASVKNPLNRLTRYSQYDAHGRARHIDYPNGLVAEITYDPRGRATQVIHRAGAQERKTTYEYDGVGQLIRVVSPDGATLQYTYDAAHRLTGINDGRGNAIVYTLDLTGNRVKEEVTDSSGTLAYRVTQQFNTLGLLTSKTGGVQ